MPQKKETILIQVCADELATYVPIRLKRDEITISQEVIILDPRPPRNIIIREVSPI